MLLYCLKCKEKTDTKNPKFVKTKNRWIMLLSNCVACGSKKSRFVIEQEASRVTGRSAKFLSKIPLEDLILTYSVVFI